MLFLEHKKVFIAMEKVIIKKCYFPTKRWLSPHHTHIEMKTAFPSRKELQQTKRKTQAQKCISRKRPITTKKTKTKQTKVKTGVICGVVTPEDNVWEEKKTLAKLWKLFC